VCRWSTRSALQQSRAPLEVGEGAEREPAQRGAEVREGGRVAERGRCGVICVVVWEQVVREERGVRVRGGKEVGGLCKSKFIGLTSGKLIIMHQFRRERTWELGFQVMCEVFAPCSQPPFREQAGSRTSRDPCSCPCAVSSALSSSSIGGASASTTSAPAPSHPPCSPPPQSVKKIRRGREGRGEARRGAG
jgi:hypothetical protein